MNKLLYELRMLVLEVLSLREFDLFCKMLDNSETNYLVETNNTHFGRNKRYVIVPMYSINEPYEKKVIHIFNKYGEHYTAFVINTEEE